MKNIALSLFLSCFLLPSLGFSKEDCFFPIDENSAFILQDGEKIPVIDLTKEALVFSKLGRMEEVVSNRDLVTIYEAKIEILKYVIDKMEYYNKNNTSFRYVLMGVEIFLSPLITYSMFYQFRKGVSSAWAKVASMDEENKDAKKNRLTVVEHVKKMMDTLKEGLKDNKKLILDTFLRKGGGKGAFLLPISLLISFHIYFQLDSIPQISAAEIEIIITELEQTVASFQRKIGILSQMDDFQIVARGGIEPPTQGFSVLCSTD